MKSVSRPFVTVFAIFVGAFVLSAWGCAPGGGSSNNPPPVAAQNNDPGAGQTAELQPISLEELRECTDSEFSKLVTWSNQLAAANEAIQELGPKSNWKKSQPATSVALTAIKACDSVENYHSLKPCKKTKTQRDVTRPDVIKKTVTGYDAYRIDERCDRVENYLNHLGVRPEQAAALPEPVPVPVRPEPPTGGLDPVDPQLPSEPPTGQYARCSDAEFSKLVTWRAALDRADKNIAKLGNQSQWKYDTIAIDAAKSATVACEAAADYHAQQPCQREKVYTAESIKAQCKTARTYYYNFAQRTDSLITMKARLWLDTKPFTIQVIPVGLSNITHGQCIVSNEGPAPIQYQGQPTLVKEARVYTSNNFQMFVMLTNEGMKLECYGMNYSSAATSLNEVMRLLRAKQTTLNMYYDLL